MGLELVHALARQLRATLAFDRAQGTRVTLRFKGGDT
jgi:two-component sensor histidine kinase